jgi:hypothetical protein
MRVVTFRRAAWTEDGASVLLGIAEWHDKPGAAARRRTRGPRKRRRRGSDPSSGSDEDTGRGARGRGAAGEPPAAEPEMADVTVWHWKDARVASVQKLTTTQDRRRNLLGVWHTNTGTFTKIGKDDEETIQIIPTRTRRSCRSRSKYAMQRSIGRPSADLFAADLATGARTPLKTGLGSNPQISPGGKYLFFIENDAVWTLN